MFTGTPLRPGHFSQWIGRMFASVVSGLVVSMLFSIPSGQAPAAYVRPASAPHRTHLQNPQLQNRSAVTTTTTTTTTSTTTSTTAPTTGTSAPTISTVPVAARASAPTTTVPAVLALASTDSEADDNSFTDDEIEGVVYDDHDAAKGTLRELALLALDAMNERNVGGDTRMVQAKLDSALLGLAESVSERVNVKAERFTAAWANASDTRMRALMTAISMVGTPYVWGGTTPRGFDCSGLTSYAWAKAGVSLPRSSGSQFAATRSRTSNPRPGDLAWKPGHIGLSLGVENIVVHSPRTGKRVDVIRYKKLNRFGSPI